MIILKKLHLKLEIVNGNIDYIKKYPSQMLNG